MRAPNAIDFWRGVALAMIFINHIPGTVFSVVTLPNYAISDAAELFVFLAGCSLSYVAGSEGARKPALQIAGVLLARGFRIWQAQIIVISAAIALLGFAAMRYSDPLLLEWHNAGPAFYDTARSSIGLMLLTYQIGYFNILPMYVVLLLMAPAFVILALWRRLAALILSLALYVVVLAEGIELPSWPADGAWFFNPLSWQLILVLGFLGTDLARSDQAFRDWLRRAWLPAVAIAIAGAAIVWSGWRPDPLAVPEPRIFFLFDKGHLSPIRVVSMLALAVAFYPVFGIIAPRIGPISQYFCRLGRNSLPVFCVLSLLALGGQIIRYLSEPTLMLDLSLIVAGLMVLGFTSWLVEFNRSRFGSPR